ncbi:MAG TPA: cytochrome c biogenesis protein CcsA [Acidimicrobiia bacterium]|jgi:heme exporter protein C|nr:cytochrome c biogenesis protein CcsA [Acidimicrobiia bacterium]
MSPLARRVLLGVTLVALGVTLFLALYVTPPRENQGFEAVRLLYLHVPCAWLAYLAFGVTALASLLWLIPRTRSATWDLLAGASAEVGVIFTALMLVVGSLWGRPTWGTWWEWDARLTTTAILFFLYLGYLALRRTGATADERGTRCAIAALIAFADVPIVHFSVSWWQTLHQKGTVFNEKLDVKVNGSMATTLLLAVAAFTMLYVYLVLERFELAQLEEGREERALQEAIAERLRTEQVVPA